VDRCGIKGKGAEYCVVRFGNYPVGRTAVLEDVKWILGR
jgi:hypothetical protein